MAHEEEKQRSRVVVACCVELAGGRRVEFLKVSAVGQDPGSLPNRWK